MSKKQTVSVVSEVSTDTPRIVQTRKLCVKYAKLSEQFDQSKQDAIAEVWPLFTGACMDVAKDRKGEFPKTLKSIPEAKDIYIILATAFRLGTDRTEETRKTYLAGLAGKWYTFLRVHKGKRIPSGMSMLETQSRKRDGATRRVTASVDKVTPDALVESLKALIVALCDSSRLRADIVDIISTIESITAYVILEGELPSVSCNKVHSAPAKTEKGNGAVKPTRKPKTLAETEPIYAQV